MDDLNFNANAEAIAAEIDDPDIDQPNRRPKPTVAQAAEPIPAEINAAHLADQVFERAFSTARNLALAL